MVAMSMVVVPPLRGGYNVLGSSRSVPPEEEMYTPHITKSRTEASSSSFHAMYFYQYIDDHFSRLNLRLNSIDDQQ